VDDFAEPAWTSEQTRALGECRFVTVYSDGGRIVAITPDKGVADAVSVSCTPFQPEQWTNPERWEYELHSANPGAIEAAYRIMAQRGWQGERAPLPALPGVSA